IRASWRSWLARATTSSNAAWSASRVRQGRESQASAAIQGDPSKRNPSRSTNVWRSSASISRMRQVEAESEVGGSLSLATSEGGIALVEVGVGGDREERGEILGQHQSVEDFGRIS